MSDRYRVEAHHVKENGDDVWRVVARHKSEQRARRECQAQHVHAQVRDEERLLDGERLLVHDNGKWPGSV